jgi:hypothetical protein
MKPILDEKEAVSSLFSFKKIDIFVTAHDAGSTA